MVTDVPTSLAGIAAGRLDFQSYFRSLQHLGTESVFSREDVLPTLMELALIPYLTVKRGY